MNAYRISSYLQPKEVRERPDANMSVKEISDVIHFLIMHFCENDVIHIDEYNNNVRAIMFYKKMNDQ